MIRRPDFELRFVLRANGAVYAIELEDETMIALAPQVQPSPWPPQIGLASEADRLTADTLFAATIVIVGDDGRAGQSEALDDDDKVIVAHFVTCDRLRSFEDDVRAALAEAGGARHPWTRWLHLGVVRYLRHALELCEAIDRTLGEPSPDLVCTWCGSPYVTQCGLVRSCRACQLHEQVPDPRADALWRAIVDAPDDDGPRLVYADYLLAHGDPRGELINVQCALERAPAARALADRERELRALRKQWLGELAAFVTGVRLERGVIVEIEIDTALLTAHHVERLVASSATRLCRTLHISDTPVSEASIIRIVQALCGADGPVRSLALARLGPPSVDAMTAIASGSHALVTLEMYEEITNDGLAALGRAGSATLESLELRCGLFDASGVAALVSGKFPRLRVLDLSRNALGDLAALAAARPLPALAEVRLVECGIDQGLASLAPLLAGVRELDLRGNAITDASLAALLAAPELAALRTLDVERNQLTDAAVDLLCAQGFQVRYHDNLFSDAAGQRLWRRFY